MSEIISTIKGLFKGMFFIMDYPDDPNKRSRRIKINAIIVIVWGVLVLTFACLFYKGVYDINNILSYLKQFQIQDWLFVCIVLFLLLIPLCYAIGVLIYWKVPEELTPSVAEENAGIIANKLEDRLMQEILTIQQCESCKDYKYSRKMLGRYLEEFDTHAKFVEIFPGFKKDPHPKDLDFIIESLNTWKYGKLLCILVNKEYYEKKEQPGSVNVTSQRDRLFKYFLCFAGIIKNTKRVKRIFCTSPIYNNNTVDVERAKWMFEYILLNVVTGVETCLFNDVDSKSGKLPKYHIDYVIGLHPDDNNSLYSKRTLFLSYDEKDANTIESKVLVCEDQLIANIFEADFYSRLRGKTKSGGVGAMSYDRAPIFIENYKKNTSQGEDYDYKKLSKDLKKVYERIRLDYNQAQECVKELNWYISNYSEENPNLETRKKTSIRLSKINFT